MKTVALILLLLVGVSCQTPHPESADAWSQIEQLEQPASTAEPPVPPHQEDWLDWQDEPLGQRETRFSLEDYRTKEPLPPWLEFYIEVRFAWIDWD